MPFVLFAYAHRLYSYFFPPFNLLAVLRYRTRNRRPKPPREFYLYRSPLLPSAKFRDSVLEPLSPTLSAVRIPLQWATPTAQLNYKHFRPSRLRRNHRSWFAVLLGLFTFLSMPPGIYAVPGTNHAIVVGKSSLDSHRQSSYARTVIENSTASETPSADEELISPDLRQYPHCFVADTDSVPFCMDTGANRVIVNDPKLLTSFKSKRHPGVKGINGTPVPVHGSGNLKFPLQADDGSDVHIPIPDAVYVPTSPYNLIPPQLLIHHLKNNGFDTRNAEHSDVEYTLRYREQGSGSRFKTATIPIGPNGLFMLQSTTGYNSFFCQACSHDPEWKDFAGSVHVIADSDDEIGESREEPLLPREESSLPREHEQSRFPREAAAPDAIPFDDSDFLPIPETAQEIDFSTADNHNDQVQEDPSLIATKRKQHLLSTYHERLGHFSFPRLQLLARAGLIPKELSTIKPPTCPGCAYGKANRKPKRFKGVANRKSIRVATAPGQVVSIDQLVSPTPGFVPTHRGNPTKKRYIGATVFADHYSDFTYVHLMTELNGESTVEAKLAFERVCTTHGVHVSHYHADNGLFDTKVFKSSIETSGQTLSFCGVNAHHQNGKAENRIKDVTQGARTSLLHAAHRWPEAVHASLWPSALKHYTNLRNSLPTKFTPGNKRGRGYTTATYDSSPISRFSGTEIEPNLKHFHPFGSPVYVLEDSLQAQHSHNKWSDRSRVGIFLCHSPFHSTSVPLVLNTQTGNVSPQFHCIYDDDFSTCKRDAKFRSLWQQKAKFQVRTSHSVDSTTVPASIPNPVTPVAPLPNAPDPLPMFTHRWIPGPLQQANPDENDDDDAEINNEDQDNMSLPDVQEPMENEPELIVPNTVEPEVQPPPAVTTRSGRRVKPKVWTSMMAYFAVFSPLSDASNDYSLLQPDLDRHAEPHPYALLLEYTSMVASSRDPDTMTLQDAMNQPDREQFIQAMYKELNDHINRKHWKVIPRSAVPKGRIPIPMVWSMKRKRNPVGEIIKWKARLCAGGHRSIEGIDYWSTYSPVVSWSTVRLMIVIALIMDWHMESIDFVLAFPQALVKTDIYMQPPKVPSGFLIPDLSMITDKFTKVYKLLKNLYGLKDAGKTWFEHLKVGLLSRGWSQSNIDSCLFTKSGIILVVYVDDAILISPSKAKINVEIASLQRDYDLTDDGELKDYLGTRFVRNSSNGTIELTQPRMIDRVLRIVGLDPNSTNTKTHDTPASHAELLDTNPDGEPRVQTWNYRSAVGCLSYLQAMIRPDITMAVQQCARFSNNPMKEHEEAVKRICRYLLKTKDRGLILKPDKSRGLECYVDADWAGSWRDRSSHDPLSSHSRTGFVIMFAGCPIMWSSKMQSLIALSTTEAEYIALSSALRDVIYVMNLLNELKDRHFTIPNPTPKVVCKVFEDNKSCIEIATNHRTRARTKHLSVRLHHFRSFVVDKVITIQHVSTTRQIADMFTKPLARVQFRILRNRLMNWPSPSHSTSADSSARREGVRE